MNHPLCLLVNFFIIIINSVLSVPLIHEDTEIYRDGKILFHIITSYSMSFACQSLGFASKGNSKKYRSILILTEFNICGGNRKQTIKN